ncbi:MAG: prepilin-type N-terminal cleavage/methylation domain-containing protein [Oceanospirillaceae bacterium]|nr:prepilin-type N-terminal cleavage/methylation domain-containing protein [Oceanospirillaceae bacterium]
MRKQFGYSLIELMIGMLVGLIVLSAIIYIFLVTLKSQKEIYSSSLLIRETNFLNDLISGELRRVGYNSGGGVASGIYAYDANSNSCIVYSYEKPSTSSAAYYGFRVANDAVEYGVGVTTSCAGGSWSAVSNDEVVISNGQFTVGAPTSVRNTTDETFSITYSFGVSVAVDQSWGRTVTKSINIRNDIDN